LQIAVDVDLAARIGFAEAKRGLDDDVARGAVGLDVDCEGGLSLAVSRCAAVWKKLPSGRMTRNGWSNCNASKAA